MPSVTSTSLQPLVTVDSSEVNTSGLSSNADTSHFGIAGTIELCTAVVIVAAIACRRKLAKIKSQEDLFRDKLFKERKQHLDRLSETLQGIAYDTALDPLRELVRKEQRAVGSLYDLSAFDDETGVIGRVLEGLTPEAQRAERRVWLAEGHYSIDRLIAKEKAKITQVVNTQLEKWIAVNPEVTKRIEACALRVYAVAEIASEENNLPFNRISPRFNTINILYKLASISTKPNVETVYFAKNILESHHGHFLSPKIIDMK